MSHEIIDAVSAVVVNLEFLAQGAEGAKQAAVDDARRSLDRIVKIAKLLRANSKPP